MQHIFKYNLNKLKIEWLRFNLKTDGVFTGVMKELDVKCDGASKWKITSWLLDDYQTKKVLQGYVKKPNSKIFPQFFKTSFYIPKQNESKGSLNCNI